MKKRTHFVNYAHRGASEYAPENTMLAFYIGLFMGANGIETDVRRTKDGALVLHHDKTLQRLTGDTRPICSLTLAELQALDFSKNGLRDKIVTLESFLCLLKGQDIRFSIELKDEGIEQDVADLIYCYGVQNKCIITSFEFAYIQNMKAVAPALPVGWLVKEITDKTVPALLSIDAQELCPRATDVTPERVREWHNLGLNVRAWGVTDEVLMRQVFDSGADGMTVNFPDKLTAYIKEKQAQS